MERGNARCERSVRHHAWNVRQFCAEIDGWTEIVVGRKCGRKSVRFIVYGV